jgi:hypothetical protein
VFSVEVDEKVGQPKEPLVQGYPNRYAVPGRDLAHRNQDERRAFGEFLVRNRQFIAEPLPSDQDATAVFLLTP